MKPLATLIAGMALALSPASASAGDGGRPDTVQVVVKFVKRGSPDRPVARFDPASCPACTPIATPLFNAENARETVIALDVPRRRSLELAFIGAPAAVRRVIVEGGDIPFRAEAGRTIVQLPPLDSDAITAAEVATHIVEPGMVLRFEHADPARRAGDYVTGTFPDTQRRAANVLEFAQREVMRETGLGEEAERRHLGRIQIMGFDTNAPHAHVDSPPHMHMHLRWPANTGTQIGHYYIGADGLLSHNIAGVRGLATSRRYERGQPFTTIAPNGQALYTHRITAEGWLQLGRAGEPPCLIRPIGADGFDAGATVACPGQAARRIAVRVDIAHGILTVDTDAIQEVFRYDPDTGRLASPTAAPPSGPSVFTPDQ